MFQSINILNLHKMELLFGQEVLTESPGAENEVYFLPVEVFILNLIIIIINKPVIKNEISIIIVKVLILLIKYLINKKKNGSKSCWA